MENLNTLNGSTNGNTDMSEGKTKPAPIKRPDNVLIFFAREAIKSIGTSEVGLQVDSGKASLSFSRRYNGTENQTAVDNFPARVVSGKAGGEVFDPTRGLWFLPNNAQLEGVFSLVPDFAEITFEVSLDGGTTPLLESKGIHADHLYLIASWTAYRNKKQIEKRFLIDTLVGEHNEARFGAR